MKMYLPSSLIGIYVRAEMNVHASMNELDQKDYWYPRKKKGENLCTKSMESWPLVSHIFWQSSIQRGRHTQLCIITSLKWNIQIHLVVWGNFPFIISQTGYYPHWPKKQIKLQRWYEWMKERRRTKEGKQKLIICVFRSDPNIHPTKTHEFEDNSFLHTSCFLNCRLLIVILVIHVIHVASRGYCKHVRYNCTFLWHLCPDYADSADYQ